MRLWLIWGIMGLSLGKAQAQTTPTVGSPIASAVAPTAPVSLLTPERAPSDYKRYLNERYANDKEARAAIHLFSRKKTGGGLWLGTGAAFIAFVASQTGSRPSDGGTLTVTVSPLGYGLLVGLFGGVGVGKLAQFSNQKLYQMLLDYDKEHNFPQYVTSRLKDCDYK